MCQKTRCEPTFEAVHMQEKDVLFVKPRQTPLSLVLLQLTAHFCIQLHISSDVHILLQFLSMTLSL